MIKPDLPPFSPLNESDSTFLERELTEAHKTIRSLLRQLSKEQARYAETVRAYNLTVANLMEVTRENASLTHERDMWKGRAERSHSPVAFGNMTLDLTPTEVSAIRKAIARLHHPDLGGDPERMKAWNAALDPLESN